jgi:hypothetical protein
MDFSILSQRDRLIKIFVYIMRLLALLLLNSEDQLPQYLFDLNEIAEKLVDIFKTFVIPNRILIEKD